MLPFIREKLNSRKKDERLGAALVLKELPKSPAIEEAAAARLPRERAKAVTELLTEITEA